METKSTLSEISLSEFKNSPRVTEKLKNYGTLMHFSAGDIILDENVYIRSIPIVIKGVIKVIRTDEDDREILLYYIREGESCIMSFLGGLHQDTSKIRAIADEETDILLIPIERVSEMIREFPEWLDYIFKLYHKRFEELLAVVNDVAFRKMDDRLGALLKQKAEISGQKEIHVTHDQLAHELGTVRVVVSRLLKQMETEGLVKLGRNKILLL